MPCCLMAVTTTGDWYQVYTYHSTKKVETGWLSKTGERSFDFRYGMAYTAFGGRGDTC